MKFVYFSVFCYRPELDFEICVCLLGDPNQLLKATHLLEFTNWFKIVIFNTVYR